MLDPPIELIRNFEPAASAQIKSWSFGDLKALRRADAPTWTEAKGTLDDERIFGPRRDFECACGKYAGPVHQGIICDVCGVKLTLAKVRGQRFGHINLKRPIPHPLFPDSVLEVAPVLPAAYWESSAGNPLAMHYEAILASDTGPDDATKAFYSVCEILLPFCQTLLDWNLPQADLVAQGMPLRRRG